MADAPKPLSPAVKAASAVLGLETALALLLAAMRDNGMIAPGTLAAMPATARRMLAASLPKKSRQPQQMALIAEEATLAIERLFQRVENVRLQPRGQLN